MGENIHCFQYHLTVSWVFFLSLWGHWQSQSLSALLSTLSWLQGPEYKKEWQPSFGEDWGEVSVSLQQTELLALAVPCQPHLLSSLPRRRTQGTYKPFRLLFCSTLNVPQVANNMRLFSPWDGTQQGCQGAPGCFPALQEPASTHPGKRRRASGRRRPHSTGNPASDRQSLKHLEKKVLRNDALHLELAPPVNILSKSTF